MLLFPTDDATKEKKEGIKSKRVFNLETDIQGENKISSHLPAASSRIQWVDLEAVGKKGFKSLTNDLSHQLLRGAGLQMTDMDRLQTTNRGTNQGKISLKSFCCCSEPETVNDTPRADRKFVSFKAPGKNKVCI